MIPITKKAVQQALALGISADPEKLCIYFFDDRATDPEKLCIYFFDDRAKLHTQRHVNRAQRCLDAANRQANSCSLYQPKAPEVSER